MISLVLPLDNFGKAHDGPATDPKQFEEMQRKRFEEFQKKQAPFQIVEATIRAHEEFWRPIVPLRPFKEQVLVYAFAHRSDHDRLHALWLTGRPSPPPLGAGQNRGRDRSLGSDACSDHSSRG